jgi:cytochrome c-type biogenesis protein CcmH
MMVFFGMAALLTLLVLAWLLPTLLRPNYKAGVTSQRLNASIYRDQLQALERDLANGAISAADHEATKDELQLRLLDDTEETAPSTAPGANVFWTARRTAVAVALLLPIGSAWMYGWLGEPDAINGAAAPKVGSEQIAKMIEGLETKLKAEPNNPMGWAMLARSYKVLGRVEEAEQAFVKAGDVVNKDPDLLVEYADLLAVRADGNIEGKPLELVKKALALNPQHPTGLMISGVAAYKRADFNAAVVQWEKLLVLLEPGSPDAQQIEASIADARDNGGTTTPGKK